MLERSRANPLHSIGVTQQQHGVSAIACGHKDAIDLDRLRHDPLMKVAVGRCPASGAPTGVAIDRSSGECAEQDGGGPAHRWDADALVRIARIMCGKRIGPGDTVVALYIEISPHTGMRANGALSLRGRVPGLLIWLPSGSGARRARGGRMA
jgi:hypothetical protein